jgi:tetratricopeptide (TPR) repeat protein
MNWKPSNQPIRYDQKRVAQLDSVERAILALRLPPNRGRKLNGILNALTMQIEDGGDSPEVNDSLLEALRAALRHQVGERGGTAVLRAIDAFQRAEAERWEQIKAGTLPPIELTPDEQLDDLMQEGYQLLAAEQTAAACDCWLQAWEIVKQLAAAEMRSVSDFDADHGLTQSVFNWSQDLEAELQNAGARNPIYHEHRLRYAREFLARFPEMETLVYVNFTRAHGEALWELGRRGESEAVYAALVERLPDEGWAYIGWADNYWLLKGAPKEYAQAVAILQRALARRNLKDRNHVLERLAELYDEWGKPDQRADAAAERDRLQAQPQSISSPTPFAPALPPQSSPSSGKPKRNAPCWCGSGKKYKFCHMQSDLRN